MPNKGGVMIEEVSHRRPVYVVAGIIFALVTGWLIFPALTREPPTTGEAPRLEGALDADAPDFEKHSERVVIAKPVVTVSSRASSDVVLELKTNLRNETGRRISGLEVRAAVVDAQGASVAERTAVIIPEQQTALEPGEEMSVRIVIEGVSPNAERADARLEVTRLRFE
jgi:hypothetical protein